MFPRLDPNRAHTSHAPRRLILHSRHSGDPIHFPSLSSILRKGLLEVSRNRGDVRPNISSQDSPAIECVLAQELPAAILELTHAGWSANNASSAVSPVQAPLLTLGIVETQRQTFDVAGRTIRFKFI